VIRNRRFVIALLIGGLAFGNATAAHADTYGVSVTPNTGLKAGDSVTVAVTGLSGTLGVYASVCKAGATQMDVPTPCDKTTEVWITATGGGGSTAGSATIVVNSSFETVNCLVDTCVVYVRGDHNNTTNYSLIRATPLTFVDGGTNRTKDTASATYGDVTLQANQPGNLLYRTPIHLIVTATSGLPVTLSSLTPDCAVDGTKVTALAGTGACAIAATTTGNVTYAPLSVNFPFYLHVARQKIVVRLATKSLRVGRSLAIPRSAFRSNFGTTVRLAATTSTTCSLLATSTGWTLTAKRVGACKLRATAAAEPQKWDAAKQLATVTIKH